MEQAKCVQAEGELALSFFSINILKVSKSFEMYSKFVRRNWSSYLGSIPVDIKQEEAAEEGEF